MTDTDPAELREYVRTLVAGGYDTRDEVVDAAVEWAADGEDEPVDEDATAALAARLTDEEIAAHLAAQQGWPATTDYDRLAAAFAALDGSGIVARENFSCCGN